MNWQYIVMDTDDDLSEIRKAKKMAGELGMMIFFKKTWNSNYIPKNITGIKEETGLDYGC